MTSKAAIVAISSAVTLTLGAWLVSDNLKPAPRPRYEFHSKGDVTIRTDNVTGAVDYFVKGVHADVGKTSLECPVPEEIDPGPDPISQW